ncbi:MAG: DUF86 domain-containing protein [Victivallales bacterium]|nr:DUF86 domain-containing protein [Victivallales bacterium]
MHIQVDDILLNKAAIIERCIKRIKTEYSLSPSLNDFTHLDALTLNIERTCQAAIDMAMHIIAIKHFGIPQTSSGAFEILYKNKIIDEQLFHSLKGMTGFRNIAIHEYQTLDNEILRHIAEKGYKDFTKFCKQLNINIRE